MSAIGRNSGESPHADSHFTVLVTGGTGALGSILVNRLADEGLAVRVFSRRATRVNLAPGIQPFDGDIRDQSALLPALAGTDAVVHLAGILRESGRTQTFDGVFREGTVAVIEAARKAGVRRLIHVTGFGADPNSPDAFTRARGLAEKATEASGLEWTIIRPSVVFGIRGSMFDRMTRSVKQTAPFAIVPLKNGMFQPLWRDDVADCIVAPLRDDETAGRVYVLGGPDAWSYIDLVRQAIRQLRLRRIILPLPAPMLLTGASLPRLIGKEAMVTASELRQLTMDNRTDPDILRSAFHVNPTRLKERLDETFRL